jgi:hypothetical protein
MTLLTMIGFLWRCNMVSINLSNQGIPPVMAATTLYSDCQNSCPIAKPTLGEW